MEPWYVYVLECKGGKLYVGISNNVQERFAKHLSGKGATFTKINRPLRILAFNEYPSKSDAAKVEYQLKRKPRSYKLAWVKHYSKSDRALPSRMIHSSAGEQHAAEEWHLASKAER